MEAARLRQRRSSRGWTREKVRALRSRTMPKENDLEGTQDQGGKHGGQAGMPKWESPPQDHRSEERRVGKECRTPSAQNASIKQAHHDPLRRTVRTTVR